MVNAYLQQSACGMAPLPVIVYALTDDGILLYPVLFIFDYCVTSIQEINFIWCRKWTMATWLFLASRYVALLASILHVAENGVISTSRYGHHMPLHKRSCRGTTILAQTLSVAKFLCFAPLRVYALLDGHLIITGVVFALTLVPFATNIYGFSQTVTVTFPEFKTGIEDCSAFGGVSKSVGLGMSLATRVAVILADLIVIFVTWSKTMQAYRIARTHSFKAPLVTMLFRDGTLYFTRVASVLFLLNVIVLLHNNILSVNPTLILSQTSWKTYDFASPFLECFTSIIICRFILDLRQLGSQEEYETPAGGSIIWFVADMGRSMHKETTAATQHVREHPVKALPAIPNESKPSSQFQ
ncbi:hypothetical protein BC835DRAFT_1308044 [Cytidiella melzeri]|nr:hypothetical protein BC835DRAFT_1308044 [Cytidiella melzeri]